MLGLECVQLSVEEEGIRQTRKYKCLSGIRQNKTSTYTELDKCYNGHTEETG